MKITLLGSTRFIDAFNDFNAGLTLAGHVVYALSQNAREEKDTHKDASLATITEDEKIVLDLVHLAKIEESDAVVVLNVGGYTGFSTKREIAWAQMRGKAVYYLEGPHSIVWQLYTTDSKPLMSSPGKKFFKKYGSSK